MPISPQKKPSMTEKAHNSTHAGLLKGTADTLQMSQCFFLIGG